MHLILHIVISFIFIFIFYSLEHSLWTVSPWFEGVRWWSSFHFFEERVARVMRADNFVYIFIFKQKWTNFMLRTSVPSKKNPFYPRRSVRSIIKLLRDASGLRTIFMPSKFLQPSYIPHTDWFLERPESVYNEFSYMYIREICRRRIRFTQRMRKLDPEYRHNSVYRFYYNRRKPDIVLKNFFNFEIFSKKENERVYPSLSLLKKIRQRSWSAQNHAYSWFNKDKLTFLNKERVLTKLRIKQTNMPEFSIKFGRFNYARPLYAYPARLDRILRHLYVDRIVLNQPKFRAHIFSRSKSRRSGRIFP